ncbi:Uncharacterized protein FWK35_00036272, partial [Aphis craccivora]
NYLSKSNGTIKYTSKTSQSSIIEAYNSVLLKNIVARVNDAKCFSILADETADISEFLQFVPEHDTSEKGLANLILESFKQFGVELKFLRGQGYDGAASMSGIYNGVQSHIRQIYPPAMYVHCSAHILNLVVSKSCGVRPIMNCLSLIG